MEDEDDSINSSPTPVRAQSSKRFPNWQNKETGIFESSVSTATGTQLECERSRLQNNDEISLFDLEEIELFEADRLDCQRAQQEPMRTRVVPASQNFVSLLSMLESQQLPLNEAEQNPVTPKQPQGCSAMKILQDCCSPPPDLTGRPTISIVEGILQDFCSSPSYDNDEKPAYHISSPFRFYNKNLRTYSRRPVRAPANVDDEDDERLSCSSGLSVQEDFITQMPMKTNLCDFDANSSQRICENLLNLSAFFSQNNANKSIDLPADRAHSESSLELLEDPQDASDILKDNGYFLGNTEECKFLDDNFDTKVTVTANKEFSLFSDRTRFEEAKTPSKTKETEAPNLFVDSSDWCAEDLNKENTFLPDGKIVKEAQKANEIQDNELLDEIPLSEWQPMDIPTVPKKLPGNQLTSNICNQLEEIPLSEWQPIYIPDSVEFRTASIEVSEEQQHKKRKLLANPEAKESSREIVLPNAVEFRTASNKTVKLTEEMRKRAAMLMADLECPAEANKQLEKASGFRTASNKVIEVTEQMQRAAKNLLADLGIEETKREAEMLEEIMLSEWQPMKISKNTATNDCSSQLDVIPLSEWQPMDLTNDHVRITAASKPNEVPEEMRPTSYTQTLEETPTEVQFRTASNKALEITEEMRKRAATLMADLETDQEPLKGYKLISESVGLPSASHKPLKPTKAKPQKSLNVETSYSQAQINICDNSTVSAEIQFRTASNKALALTEEMCKRAAMLMADLESVQEPSEDAKQVPASNKQIKLVEQHKATTVAVENVARRYSQKLGAAPVDVQFRSASKKSEDITEEVSDKAATLLADLYKAQEPAKDAKISRESVNLHPAPSKPIKDSPPAGQHLLTDIERENTAKPLESDHVAKDLWTAATPQAPSIESRTKSMLETPKCTPELQDSLTQLTERSPLDKETKSSIITRRNLLSLNKRRKSKKDNENKHTAQNTPHRKQFTPMATSTSTPVPHRKEHRKEDSHSEAVVREQDVRVGKRRSEEALSPIYAPTNKTRRLGLSRIRNRSSNDI